MPQIQDSTETAGIRGRIARAWNAATSRPRVFAAAIATTAVAFFPARSSAASAPEPFDPLPEHPPVLMVAGGPRHQITVSPEPEIGDAAVLDADQPEIGSAVQVTQVQKGDSLWKMAEAAVIGSYYEPTDTNVALVVDWIIEQSNAVDTQSSRRFDRALANSVVTADPADPDTLHVGDVIQTPASVHDILGPITTPTPPAQGLSVTG